MTFFHFTCSHAAPDIRREGLLRPGNQLGAQTDLMPPGMLWMLSVVWVTDMADPDVQALGLSRETITCDRTEWRIEVSNSATLVPWHRYARALPVPRDQREQLERGHRPAHWWVSTEPVPVDVATLTRLTPSGAS